MGEDESSEGPEKPLRMDRWSEPGDSERKSEEKRRGKEESDNLKKRRK